MSSCPQNIAAIESALNIKLKPFKQETNNDSLANSSNESATMTRDERESYPMFKMIIEIDQDEDVILNPDPYHWGEIVGEAIHNYIKMLYTLPRPISAPHLTELIQLSDPDILLLLGMLKYLNKYNICGRTAKIKAFKTVTLLLK